MSNTWSHNCNSTGEFYLIEYGHECPHCKINSMVECIRHAGYIATPFVSKQKDTKIKQLAALLMGKQRQA